MTSATLFREGDDLEALLADLEAQHPGRVRLVDVSYPREGGVLGFFSRQRVAVQYEIDAEPAPDGPRAEGEDFASILARHGISRSDDAGNPLAELIAAAEQVETRERATDAAESRSAGTRPHVAGPAPAGDPDNVEFAKLLLEMASRKSLERRAGSSEGGVRAAASSPVVPSSTTPATSAAASSPFVPGSFAVPGPSAAPPPATRPAPWMPAERITRRTAPNRTEPPTEAEQGERLTLRRQLADIGVPIGWIPDAAVHRYAAVEQLVARLPEAAPLPSGCGEIAVLTGPAAAVLPAVQLVAARMRIGAERIWAAGCPDADPARSIDDPWQAAGVAADLRLSASGPSLFVVATDAQSETELHRAGELIRALRPEALWAHVDATRKAADSNRILADLGTPSALVVTGAHRTASPASVWDTGVPVALLDNRPATRSEWAVLLLDKLAELES